MLLSRVPEFNDHTLRGRAGTSRRASRAHARHRRRACYPAAVCVRPSAGAPQRADRSCRRRVRRHPQAHRRRARETDRPSLRPGDVLAIPARGGGFHMAVVVTLQPLRHRSRPVPRHLRAGAAGGGPAPGAAKASGLHRRQPGPGRHLDGRRPRCQPARAVPVRSRHLSPTKRLCRQPASPTPASSAPPRRPIVR